MSKNQDLGELINGIKSLATNQLNAPAYTSATSFTGTIAGFLGFDTSGNILTASATTSGITGSGTASYLARWTGTSVIGQSNLFENADGTVVLSGTSTAGTAGTGAGRGNLILAGSTSNKITFNNNSTTINGFIYSDSSGLNISAGVGLMVFETNNIERLRITSAGYIGIGINNPVARLQVNSGNFSGLRVDSNATYDAIVIGGTGAFRIDAPSIINGRFVVTDGGNTGIGVISPAYKLDVAGDVNISGTFRVNGTPINTGGGGISGSGTTNYISKWSAGTALTNSGLYESGGKLAYNTTSPFYQLDWKIKSNVQIGFGFGTVYSADDSAGLVAHGGGGISNTVPIGFAASTFLFYVGFTEAMRINTSRNLLINTTGGISGGGALQVDGDVNVTGTFRVNGVQYSTGGGGGIGGGGTTDFIPKFIGGSTIGNSAMWDNGNFSIHLGMTGFTGIGGQPDRYIGIYGPSSSGIILKGDTSDSQATSYINRTNGSGNLTIFDPREIYLLTGNATFIKLNGSGVGINTQPAGTPYMFVLPNDSLQSARAFAWYTYSDERVKRDIEEISYGLNEVMQMKAVKYKHYSSVFENNSFTLQNTFKNEIGFVAQDMHKIVKEAVQSGNDSELWSLDKSKLIPVLVKAIQELKSELDIIKTNIA